jgi:hypothetical protein
MDTTRVGDGSGRVGDGSGRVGDGSGRVGNGAIDSWLFMTVACDIKKRFKIHISYI